MYTQSEKAAQSLVEAAGRFDWNSMLFAGHILNQHNVVIQKHIIDGMVIYLTTYQRYARNPSLAYMTAMDPAEMIDAVDLTEFDHPW